MRGGLSRREILLGCVTYLFRLVVGIVFLYSGFVKAVDPWGTVYKLQEYLGAMHAGWLGSLATAGSFALFMFEGFVGFSLLTGSYRRWSVRLGALFMAFMLPLTLWIAVKEPVSDCGCFGDALHLSNWQTFYKNVALLGMLVWLLRYNDGIRCFILPTLQVWGATATLLVLAFIGFVGYQYQPLLDFRPYPKGGVLVGEDEGNSEGLLAEWRRGSEVIRVSADSIPEGEGWEFAGRVEEGNSKKGAGKGLAVYEWEEDVTEDVISGEGDEVVLFFPSVRDVSIADYYKLNSLYAYARSHGVEMVAIGSGTDEQVETFKEFSLAEYPAYRAEDTAIKEVVRGNPGVVFMHDGKIVWKSSLGGLETDDFMDGSVRSLNEFERDEKGFLEIICVVYFGFVGVLVLLSHVPMFFRRLRRGKHMSGNVSVALCVLALLTVGCKGKSEEPSYGDGEKKELTVLVYMVASNDLSVFSSGDVQEIIEGVEAVEPGVMNVLVYRVLPNGEAELGEVSRRRGYPAEWRSVKRYGNEALSLTRGRMRDVLSEVKRRYPAERWGLFLWSHASNWLPAHKVQGEEGIKYSFGEDNGYQMNLGALAEALPYGAFDFIWMDCCYMGSVEVAYELRNKARYMVASPTALAGVGCPYQIVLPMLASGVEMEDLRKGAIAEFEYFAQNSESRLREATITLVDLGGMENVALAYRACVEGGGKVSTVGLQGYGSQDGVPFYDTRTAGARMNAAKGEELRRALEECVVYHDQTAKAFGVMLNLEFCCGLSVTLSTALTTETLKSTYHALSWYKAVYSE